MFIFVSPNCVSKLVRQPVFVGWCSLINEKEGKVIWVDPWVCGYDVGCHVWYWIPWLFNKIKKIIENIVFVDLKKLYLNFQFQFFLNFYGLLRNPVTVHCKNWPTVKPYDVFLKYMGILWPALAPFDHLGPFMTHQWHLMPPSLPYSPFLSSIEPNVPFCIPCCLPIVIGP